MHLHAYRHLQATVENIPNPAQEEKVNFNQNKNNIKKIVLHIPLNIYLKFLTT